MRNIEAVFVVALLYSTFRTSLVKSQDAVTVPSYMFDVNLTSPAAGTAAVIGYAHIGSKIRFTCKPQAGKIPLFKPTNCLVGGTVAQNGAYTSSPTITSAEIIADHALADNDAGYKNDAFFTYHNTTALTAGAADVALESGTVTVLAAGNGTSVACICFTDSLTEATGVLLHAFTSPNCSAETACGDTVEKCNGLNCTSTVVKCSFAFTNSPVSLVTVLSFILTALWLIVG